MKNTEKIHQSSSSYKVKSSSQITTNQHDDSHANFTCNV